MVSGPKQEGRTSVIVVASVLLLGVTSASAADLDRDCCGDLEARVAELEATAARSGTRNISLTVSGQINNALLIWDDGKLNDVYQGTNDTARTRFRFLGAARIDPNWSAGYLLEIGVRTNRLNRTDQFHDDGYTNTPNGPQPVPDFDIRHTAWWLKSKQLGEIWLGNTDQATESITEINTANTAHFLKHYGSWTGSYVLRLKETGELAIGSPGTQEFVPSTNFRSWGNILPQSGFTGQGVPGEGDRWPVVKYETPSWAGFTLSAAWGDKHTAVASSSDTLVFGTGEFWDVALRYAGEVSGFKVAGGIGYADWNGEFQLNPRGCSIVDATSDFGAACSQLGLSGSIMHLESGLFVTGAYGIKWDDRRQETFAVNADATGPIDNDDDFYYVLAGIEKKVCSLGPTTIYGEYEHYDTGAGISGSGETASGTPRSFTTKEGFPNPGGSKQFMAGANIDIWGIGINQHVDAAALDLYIAYRRAEAEVFTSDTGVKVDPGATTVAIEPMHMIMTGALVKF